MRHRQRSLQLPQNRKTAIPADNFDQNRFEYAGKSFLFFHPGPQSIHRGGTMMDLRLLGFPRPCTWKRIRMTKGTRFRSAC